MSPLDNPVKPETARPSPGPAALCVYEMRPLLTDAQRAEAGALVEDRLSWLAARGVPLPGSFEGVPALFREERHQSVGLFEDDVLLGCLILDREADLGHWGRHGARRGLFLGHVHTLPERPDNIVRLITLWASDYAARHNVPYVRAEVPAGHDPRVATTESLLSNLQDMGWEHRGTGTGTNGEPVTRLELRADPHLRLTPLILCTVPFPAQALSGHDRSTS